MRSLDNLHKGRSPNFEHDGDQKILRKLLFQMSCEWFLVFETIIAKIWDQYGPWTMTSVQNDWHKAVYDA